MEITVFIGATLALVAGCLVPNRWLPARMPNDKLMHFAAFFLLSLLALRIATGRMESAIWLGGLFVAGWLIEILQKLLPDRGFSWRDIAANTAGIVTAALCVAVIGAI
jgi:VanZ family protein